MCKKTIIFSDAESPEVSMFRWLAEQVVEQFRADYPCLIIPFV